MVLSAHGAGKSTTIRTLLALIQPHPALRLFSARMALLMHRPLRKKGYLPGEVYYYDKRRVRTRFIGQFMAKIVFRILTDCKCLDLDQNKRIDFVSVIRKWYCSGLLYEPELIILDELTTGLDPLMQQTFSIPQRREREGRNGLFSHIYI